MPFPSNAEIVLNDIQNILEFQIINPENYLKDFNFAKLLFKNEPKDFYKHT